MNIIIKNSKWVESDKKLLFGDEPVEIVDATDLQDLCIKLGQFKTRSEAFRAGRKGEIPKGYTDGLKISKKLITYIWNPTKSIQEYE